jgi:hypothetical protein
MLSEVYLAVFNNLVPSVYSIETALASLSAEPHE